MNIIKIVGRRHSKGILRWQPASLVLPSKDYVSLYLNISNLIRLDTKKAPI